MFLRCLSARLARTRSPVAQAGDDSTQSSHAEATVKTSRDDKIRAAALFRIRHLLLQDRRKAGLGHSRAAHYPLPLQHPWRRNHDDVIAPRSAVTFVQQRYIEHSNPLSAGAGLRQKPSLVVRHHRVQDGFQPCEGRWIAKNTLPKPLPVDASTADAHSGKLRIDREDSPSTRRQQPVNYLISIE